MITLVLLLSAIEAVVLAGLLMSHVRLRTRIRQVSEASSARVGQMRELVQEARTLSDTIASQLTQQLRQMETQTKDKAARAVTESAGAEARRPAAPPKGRAALASTASGRDPSSSGSDREEARVQEM